MVSSEAVMTRVHHTHSGSKSGNSRSGNKNTFATISRNSSSSGLLDVPRQSFIGGKNSGGGGGKNFIAVPSSLISSSPGLLPMQAHHQPSGPSFSSSDSLLSCFSSPQALCDEVIGDTIKCCQEADYKMELAKLLSQEARIELYIELGKLNNAHRLAFEMRRSDYVLRIIAEAEKLNQNHVRTVCQHWLAKHESIKSDQDNRLNDHKG